MRVLVTGLAHVLGWPRRAGARAAARRRGRRRLDTHDPRIPLERTEFVRTDSTYSILARIVRATQVDTIVHTHLIVDSTRATGRTLHEINVIGTMNLLAAAGAAGSPVRKVVLKSSALVYGAQLPGPVLLPRGHDAHACRRAPPSSVRCSRSRRSCATSPTTTRTSTSRCCGSRTCSATTSTRRSRPRCAAPVVPEIFGFDPRVQFVHEDDVVGALMYATTNDVPGVYNVGRRRQHAVERGVRDRRQAAHRAPAGAHRTSRPSRCALLRLVGPAARGAEAAALRPRRSTTPATSGPASATSTRPRARSRRSRRGLRLGRHDRRQATRRTATSASRGLLPPLARRRPPSERTEPNGP